MLSSITNPSTGFIVGGVQDPTYWAPDNFRARYGKTADETRRALNIEKKARDDALQLLPLSDSSEWSQTEQEVRTRCQEALTSEVDTLRKEIDAYKAEVTRNRGLADKAQIDQQFDNNKDALVGEVRNQMSANGSGAGRELIEALKDKDRLQREYNAFQREHRLREQAKYPDSTFWHYFIIALILVGEGLANSYFFGQGNDLGMLGGFLEALFFAAINVGFAGMVAFCLRYTFHISSGRKAVGWFGVLLFTGLMIFVACIAALYRYQAANASDTANLGLLSLPWADLGTAIATKDGILLIMLALILGIVAVLDWFKMDDPYPGYGKRQRALEEVSDWIKERQGEAIDEIHGGFVKRMRETEIPSLEGKLKILITRAQNIERVTRDYDQAIVKQLESAYHQLLKEYREENEFVRTSGTTKSSPAPKYFSEYPPLQPSDFNAKLQAREAGRWLEEYSTALTYFETRKHEAMSDKYSLSLKTVVVENFESAVAQLQKDALAQNEMTRSV